MLLIGLLSLVLMASILDHVMPIAYFYYWSELAINVYVATARVDIMNVMQTVSRFGQESVSNVFESGGKIVVSTK